MKSKKKSGAAKKDIPIVKKVSPKMKKGDLKKKMVQVTKDTSANKGDLMSTLNNTTVISPKNKRMSSNVSKGKNGNVISPGIISGKATSGRKRRNRKRKADDVPQRDTESPVGDKMEVSTPTMKRNKRLVEVSTPTMKRDKRKKGKGQAKTKVEESSPTPSRRNDNALEYLKLWNEDRENWKFKKAQQIWLNDHTMDNTLMSNEIFQIWLKYMEGASVSQKKVVLGKATAVMAALEKGGSTVDAGDVKCQRAQAIIQSMGVDDESSS